MSFTEFMEDDILLNEKLKKLKAFLNEDNDQKMKEGFIKKTKDMSIYVSPTLYKLKQRVKDLEEYYTLSNAKHIELQELEDKIRKLKSELNELTYYGLFLDKRIEKLTEEVLLEGYTEEDIAEVVNESNKIIINDS